MLKKSVSILSILSGVFLLFLAIHSIRSQNIEQKLTIDQLKLQAIDYIRQDKQIDANTAIKTILKDYGSDEKMPSSVYSVAEAYRNNSKFTRAIELYKNVINNQPASKEAAMAQSGLSVSLAAKGDIESSKVELENLKANYSNDPCIAQLVFSVAESMAWFKHFADSNTVYKYVLEKYPDSDWGMFSVMSLAISCVGSNDYISAEQWSKKLAADYAKNSRLPEALFYVAGRLGYGKNYDKANELYKQIITDWPEDKWAKNAALESAKLKVVQNINIKDEPNTLKAIDTQFSSYDKLDLPAILMELAAKSDSVSQYGYSELTKKLYNKVISNNPASPQAITAKLSLDRINLISELDYNNVNLTEYVNKFIYDHNSVQGLFAEVSKISEHYQNNIVRTPPWFSEFRADRINKMIAVCDIIIEKSPDSFNKLNAYKFAADLLRNKDSLKSLGYYQKILDTWPDYDGTGEILYSMGECYNNMIINGIITNDEAVPLIKETFEKVAKNYPNTDSGRNAKYCLNNDPRLKSSSTVINKEGGKQR